MLRPLLALFIFIAPLSLLTAQTSLFVARNFQKPYEKGTRSWDGKPGPNYWQNRANYVIKASLDPKTRRLSGEENITYINNSPDSLKLIRFKLQHDRYRKGAQRSSDVTPSDVSDEGTRIEALTYNGQSVDERQYTEPRGERFAQREQNLTWAAQIGPDNRITEGINELHQKGQMSSHDQGWNVVRALYNKLGISREGYFGGEVILAPFEIETIAQIPKTVYAFNPMFFVCENFEKMDALLDSYLKPIAMRN